MVTGVLSLGLKWPGREESPTIGDVRKERSHSSTISTCLHGVDRDFIKFCKIHIKLAQQFMNSVGHPPIVAKQPNELHVSMKMYKGVHLALMRST